MSKKKRTKKYQGEDAVDTKPHITRFVATPIVATWTPEGSERNSGSRVRLPIIIARLKYMRLF